MEYLVKMEHKVHLDPQDLVEEPLILDGERARVQVYRAQNRSKEEMEPITCAWLKTRNTNYGTVLED